MTVLETLKVAPDCEWIRNWFAVDARDLLHQPSSEPVQWTTVNLGEVFPGVPTPLNWAVLGSAGELGLRRALHAIGTYDKSETAIPADVSRRTIGIMWGRGVANLDVFRDFADRTPGTSGDAMEAQIFGSSQTAGTSRRTFRRYPAVLAKMPLAAIARRRTLLQLQKNMDVWWQQTVFRTAPPDRMQATALLWEAHRRIADIFDPHNVIMMVALGLYNPVRSLAARKGFEGLESQLLFTGDTLETQTVADLWAVSRKHLTLAAFIGRHGFHGPQENELSSRVWREDDAPLRRLVARYGEMAESASPAVATAERLRAREEAGRQLFSKLNAAQRLTAGLLLRLARRYVPLREVGRDSFLKGMDVVRYAARLIGTDLQQHGILEQADDAFYLTPIELTELPRGLSELVAFRRGRRAYYESLELPQRWRGHVEPTVKVKSILRQGVRGVGVSAGIVEGLVRVVLDPAADELEEGEILVCRTTDPGWASYFFIASGVVIEIGGALSHGAIIARELGLPCVINAPHATEELVTGDRVRIDGTRGTVELLQKNRAEIQA